jgi:hypothetical protein
MPWYSLKTFRADPDALGGGRYVGKSAFFAPHEDAAKREAQCRADALSTAYFVTLFDDRGVKLWITEAQDA